MMTTPSEKAAVIAQMLDRDPVAAAMICEHLKVDRVLELLNLPDEGVRKYYGIKSEK